MLLFNMKPLSFSTQIQFWNCDRITITVDYYLNAIGERVDAHVFVVSREFLTRIVFNRRLSSNT